MHVQATPPRGLAFYPRLKLTKSDNVFVPYLLYHCFFLSFFLLPSSGHLLRRQTASEPLENGRVLAQGSSFTYQDILAGLVGYMPGGPGVAVDEFQFSLTDGLHTDTGRMEIYIELPTSDTPHLAVNRGLQLSAGTRAWKRVAMVSSLFLHNASFHVSSVGGSWTRCAEFRETCCFEDTNHCEWQVWNLWISLDQMPVSVNLRKDWEELTVFPGSSKYSFIQLLVGPDLLEHCHCPNNPMETNNKI